MKIYRYDKCSNCWKGNKPVELMKNPEGEPELCNICNGTGMEKIGYFEFDENKIINKMIDKIYKMRFRTE